MLKVYLSTLLPVVLLFTAVALAQDNLTEFEREHKIKVETWVETLSSADRQKALQAGVSLEQNVKPSDLGFLVSRLKKGNEPFVQQVLARAIAQTGDQRATKGLIFELEHGGIVSKREAVKALGYVADDFAINAIMEGVKKSNDVEYLVNSINALTRIGSARAQIALRSFRSAVYSQVDFSKRYSVNFQLVDNALQTSKKVLDGGFEPGKTDFEIKKGIKQTLTYDGIEYIFYQPPTRYSKTTKPVVMVCIHNEVREVDSLYEKCHEVAQKNGAALVVPIYDTWHFPDYDMFNCHGKRSDLFLLNLVDFLAEKQDLETTEIFILGQGDGGNFVQRFALAYPSRIGRAAARPNNNINPTYNRVFPDGLTSNPYCTGVTFRETEFLKTDLSMMPRINDNEIYEDWVLSLAKRGRELQITSRINMPATGGLLMDEVSAMAYYLFRSSIRYRDMKTPTAEDFPL